MRLIWVWIFLIMVLIASDRVMGGLKDFYFVAPRRGLIFVEDYYRLYRMNLHGDTASHLANIYYLKKGLKAAKSNLWWEHPSKTMGYGRSGWANEVMGGGYGEAEHAKYKELMKMRISLLLTQSYMRLASRYDRENLYWFHVEDYESLKYMKEWGGSGEEGEHYLKRGFRIALGLYGEARKYWEETKGYVDLIWEGRYEGGGRRSGELYRDIDLRGEGMDIMEDEAYKIYHRSNERYKREEKDYYMAEDYPEFNYDKVIKDRELRIKGNEEELSRMIRGQRVRGFK